MIWIYAIAGTLMMGYGVWYNDPRIVVIGMVIIFSSLIDELFGASAECEGKDYGKEEKDDL